jgi:predicted ATPase
MITINETKEATCILFAPSGDPVGLIQSYLSLMDVRNQIAKQSLSGYYIRFQGQRIDIASNGDLSAWPAGFYDGIQTKLNELARIRRDKKQQP